jgi:type II secretory pathway pseudopilin PulG
MLIVMALIAMMAGLMYPTIQKQLVRVRTMTSAKQVVATFQRARLEAIRRNTPGTVEIDLAGRRVVANVDTVNFVGLLSAGVEFGAPPGEVIVDGFGLSDKANFTIAGGVQEEGAFRIMGPHKLNFVEVRIDPPATARIQVLKWDGSEFRAQGELGVSWTW